MGVLGGILGLSLILMTFTKEFDYIVGLIGVASFCFMYINTYSYLFISENFEGALASFVTLMYSTFWAISGILYAIFAHFTKASWKPLCLICGLFGLLGGVLLLLTREEEKERKENGKRREEGVEKREEGLKEEEGRKEEGSTEGWKEEEEGMTKREENGSRGMKKVGGGKEEGLLESLREVWQKPQIRTNFLVYAGFWSFYTVCYCCILIELESVGGNLYFNMVLCSIIELIACALAGWLGGEKKAEEEEVEGGRREEGGRRKEEGGWREEEEIWRREEPVKEGREEGGWEEGRRREVGGKRREEGGSTGIIRNLLNFLGLFFGIFVFAPSTLGGSSGSIFFIICLLGAKLNNDTLNLVTYLNLKKAFTARFVGVWMLLSRFTSRFLGLFIPYLNFGFRTLGVHPFVFYGFVWVLCRLSFSRVREISCLKDEKEIPLIVLKKEERI